LALLLNLQEHSDILGLIRGDKHDGQLALGSDKILNTVVAESSVEVKPVRYVTVASSDLQI
jgi:hypothetical protein